MRHLLILLVLAACSSSEDAKATCEGPLGKPLQLSEIDAMSACCQAEPDGQAHCLDAAKVPAALQSFVATCESGGYCIPDSMLATGASQPPATCTAFGGQAVCLSRCIPQVAENAALLRKDTCAGVDELCVPCISPLDNMPTGACDLLAFSTCVGDAPPENPTAACDDPVTCNYEATCPALIDPASLVACGADAHCVDPALVTDPAQAARLGRCDDGVALCVPDAFIRTGGKFTAPTCTSVNGNEGRCLSTVLPDVQKQQALLPRDTCAETERCTPCFDPLTGAATGACSLSCDAGPTQPAKPFAQCCGGRARCVPAANIPDAQEDQLEEDACEDTTAADLCVPNELIADGPFPTCAANSFLLGNYTGVCLSDCLDFGIQGVALARGDCQSGYKCAPCEQNGEPTGAPGCPP